MDTISQADLDRLRARPSRERNLLAAEIIARIEQGASVAPGRLVPILGTNHRKGGKTYPAIRVDVIAAEIAEREGALPQTPTELREFCLRQQRKWAIDSLPETEMDSLQRFVWQIEAVWFKHPIAAMAAGA